MKRIMRLSFFSLLLCLFSVLILVGCGGDKSGSTIDEPEITGDYLAEEYSQQLLTDGAETILGFISVEKKDAGYKVSVAEKDVVPSADYDEGYYIADTNMTKDLELGSDARIACLHEDKLKVETPEEFIKNHSSEESQLYTVYFMGSSAELILAEKPENVEIE